MASASASPSPKYLLGRPVGSGRPAECGCGASFSLVGISDELFPPARLDLLMFPYSPARGFVYEIIPRSDVVLVCLASASNAHALRLAMQPVGNQLGWLHCVCLWVAGALR